MDITLKEEIKDLTIEQLVNHTIGDRLGQGMKALELVQTHVDALAGNENEEAITGVKIGTTLTFSILTKISSRKNLSDFDDSDWREIASDVSKIAILEDGQNYSLRIFNLYVKYIRFSADALKSVGFKSTDDIFAIADELEANGEKLISGEITEVKYTEECLWLCLEAMIKLLASTVFLSKNSVLGDLSLAVSSYAFEYGRLVLYSRELEIIDGYLDSQKQLDDKLKEKYNVYLGDLEKQSKIFCEMINNAFVPNFREAFIGSAKLAFAAGVKHDEVLMDKADVDDFFMN